MHFVSTIPFALYGHSDMSKGLFILLFLLIGIVPAMTFYFVLVIKAKMWEHKLLPLHGKLEKDHFLFAYTAAAILVLRADPRDSMDKKAILRYQLSKLRFDPKRAKKAFRLLLQHELSLKHLTNWMNVRLNADERDAIMYLMIELTLEDGSVTGKEYTVFKDLTHRTGISLKQLKTMIAAQQQKKAREDAEDSRRQQENKNHFKKHSTPSKSKRKQAFEVLGVSEHASEQEIKKAYRTLVKKYHPDRFSGQGETKINLAKERFIEIQLAYDLIESS